MSRSLLVLLALCLSPTAAAAAADIQVTSTADGPGSCASGSATCTVRQALADAKGLPGRDTVRVPPGTYALTGQDLIVSIGEQVDVVGTDPRTTVLQEISGGDRRVFLVEQDASLGLRGLTVTGGTGASGVLLFGGGNELRATDTIFTANTGVRGGAINATGPATVVLDRVTLHGNSATERGGAVRLADAGGTLAVSRSTISGNTAPVGSGVAVQNGTATLSQATVTDGLDVAAPGAVQLRASVLGGCAGGVPASQGANVDSGATCALAGPGDRSSVDPLLAPLGDHGGPTPTRLPQPGSPLLDADPACAAGEVDQRGVLRPQGPACDIGAVEVAVATPVPPPVATPAPTPAPPAVARAPRITRLALASTRIRRGRATTLKVRVTGPAVLRLRVERLVRGRWRLQPGAVERTVRGGSSSLRFETRLRGRALPRGRHRLVVRSRARATGSPSGPASRRAFRVT